jgi:rRNA maturation endonuclease Nob1
MKEFVMDSPVILNNFNFSFSDNEVYFTTNEILNEMIDLRSKQIIEAGLKQGKIKIKQPSKHSINAVKQAAKELSIPHKLSDADYSILALALELKFPLLTDDYHMQKVCLKLDLPFDSVFREKLE